MKQRLMAILLAGLIPAGLLRGEDGKADLDQLQGSWEVTAMEMGGKATAAKDLPGKVTVTFTGEKMEMDGPLAAAEGEKPVPPAFTVKLDPSKNPKAIDTVALTGRFKGKTQPGIYRLEGDELTLCLPNQEAKVRPTEFESPAGSELVVMTLKRSKE
jgi:uncharacterized protein (TIGR03067 family)